MESALTNIRAVMGQMQQRVKTSIGKLLFGKQYQTPEFDYIYNFNVNAVNQAAGNTPRSE